MDCSITARQRPVLDINATYLYDTISGRVSSADQIIGAMSHVCTVGREPYILVQPDVVWLTEANAYEAMMSVMSNVAWEIE